MCAGSPMPMPTCGAVPRLVVLDEVQRLRRSPKPFVASSATTGGRASATVSSCCGLGIAGSDEAVFGKAWPGRISFLELSGVNVDEAASSGIGMDDRWVREGF